MQRTTGGLHSEELQKKYLVQEIIAFHECNVHEKS